MRSRAVRYSGYFFSTAVLPLSQPGFVPVGVTIFTSRFATDGDLPSGVMISRPRESPHVESSPCDGKPRPRPIAESRLRHGHPYRRN